MNIDSKLLKILDKYFPDEMDSSMYHPNISDAVSQLKQLINEFADEVIGESEFNECAGFGECSLCGKYLPLNEDHYCPQNARNNVRSEIRKRMEELLK